MIVVVVVVGSVLCIRQAEAYRLSWGEGIGGWEEKGINQSRLGRPRWAFGGGSFLLLLLLAAFCATTTSDAQCPCRGSDLSIRRTDGTKGCWAENLFDDQTTDPRPLATTLTHWVQYKNKSVTRRGKAGLDFFFVRRWQGTEDVMRPFSRDRKPAV